MCLDTLRQRLAQRHQLRHQLEHGMSPNAAHSLLWWAPNLWSWGGNSIYCNFIWNYYLYYILSILYYSIYYILLKNCSRSDSELQSLRPMYYVPLQYTLNLPLLRQVQGHPEHHVQGSYSGLIPFFMFCTIADYHDNHIYFVADSLDAWFCLRAVNHHCPDALDVIISYQILTSYSDTLLIRTCTIYANLDHMNHSFLLLLWSLNLVCILHTPARPKASTIRDVGSLMETTSFGHEWPRL